MTTPICIEIPSDVHEDDWKKLLQSRLAEFKLALDLRVGVDPDDHRLTINSIHIEELEIFEDEVFINYSINWSIYYGCEDQDTGDDEHSHISAERRGNVLIFKPFVYPERRSTFEEY